MYFRWSGQIQAPALTWRGFSYFSFIITFFYWSSLWTGNHCTSSVFWLPWYAERHMCCSCIVSFTDRCAHVGLSTVHVNVVSVSSNELSLLSEDLKTWRTDPGSIFDFDPLEDNIQSKSLRRMSGSSADSPLSTKTTSLPLAVSEAIIYHNKGVRCCCVCMKQILSTPAITKLNSLFWWGTIFFT